ncbi:right-handed parallel beta-helix repeat-containing protein [Haloferula sp. BvORR071]|uniref:right-handed parallel beta-helix repeat-containing protein n=1 Tax=Haloferula sp. BvORR071 TaxID=1396141 RepID=UPI00054EEDD7|nr:right-handed parallel beta-helix repeat-containing protein [Haloferula sp. BvORR071]
MGFGLSHETHAAILTVTSLADTGPGTLRDQIAAAASGDTIDFSVTGTITLTSSGHINIAKDLTIAGPGAGSLIVKRINYATSIFDISSGSVGISGITLTDGNGNGITDSAGFQSYGGAIYMTGGTLTIADTTFSANGATNGGAIYMAAGTLAVTGSTLSNNNAENGGAIYVAGGTLTIGSSTISGNTAAAGGGIINSGTATITDSTISGNTANADALGLGGGVLNTHVMTIRNCTISANRSLSVHDSAQPGGGGINNFDSGCTLAIANSTITGNSARLGGGIKSQGTLNLSNTIVAGNTASSGPDIYDIFGSTGGSYNIIGQSPLLGPLQNNGGPTKTHAPLAGSPAIDAGDPAFDATSTPYDQRGANFPRIKKGRVCIGAVESDLDQGSSLVVDSLADHDDGTAGANDCTLREAVRYVSPGGTITFSVTGQITLTGGEMVIAKNLTIAGPAGVPGVTISGNHASRIFSVTQGTVNVSNTVNFSNLTLSEGNGVGAINSGAGGAIYSGNFTPPIVITVTNCTLSGNQTTLVGGALRNGGTMAVTNCTLADNSSALSAGAIQNSGSLTLTNSTFSSNSTTGSSPNGSGGALRSSSNLTVTGCTFAGNSASIKGGAIDIAAGTASLSNTIVAGNSAPTGPDLSGSVGAGDCNLVQNPSGVTLAGTHNLTGQAANLGALADNGGPTHTFELLTGSPAINAGSNALIPGGVTTDQRSFARVDSGTVDIGAYELDVTPPSVTINQAAGQSDPTISTPIHFTVVFSEAVTGFTTGDVILSGSAGATTATVTGSGPNYDVAVTGMTWNGTVIATIAAGVALDLSANGNTIATSSDNAISYSSAETVQNSGSIRAEVGGGFTVGFIGNAGQEYTIQFSSDLAPGDWQTLRTQAADSSGVISFLDTPPSGTPRRFYRLLLP